MAKFDHGKAVIAVRESMAATVAEFGIGFVRTLSIFPSARVNELKKAA